MSTSSSECGPRCVSNDRCTHFTWIDINDGTCFLRSGNVSKSDAIYINDPTRVCGLTYYFDYRRINQSITWDVNNQSRSCDFKDNDLSNVQIVQKSVQRQKNVHILCGLNMMVERAI